MLQHNCSVVSKKHTRWSLLCHLAHKVPVVSVISNFLRGGVIGPMPNPQPGGPGSVLCGPCSPSPNQQGQTYQGLGSVPAFIALGIIEALKRHYNNRGTCTSQNVLTVGELIICLLFHTGYYSVTLRGVQCMLTVGKQSNVRCFIGFKCFLVLWKL